MKRFVAMLLAIMTFVSLAACKRIENDPDETTDSEIVTPAPNETTEKEPEDTTEPEETTEADSTAEDTTIADTTEEDTTEPIVEINSETAVRIAKDYLGERDPDTGYLYSYQYVETTAEGEFKIKVSWYLEEDERYSTCGYLLVTPEGKITKFDW